MWYDRFPHRGHKPWVFLWRLPIAGVPSPMAAKVRVNAAAPIQLTFTYAAVRSLGHMAMKPSILHDL